MESHKNRKLDVIILLIIVALFLGMCQLANAQEMDIERHITYNKFYKKNVVCKYPSYGLEVVNGNDTIYFSILADSISPRQYGIRLYAYFPEGTDLNNSAINIGLSDGSEYYLTFNSIDNEISYVEYDLTDELFHKMYKIGVKTVSFNYSDKKLPIDDEYYFYAFLNRQYR